MSISILPVIALVLSLNVSVFAVAAAPLGNPGTVAGYRLEADPAARPDFEKDNQLTVISAEIHLGPVLTVANDRLFQWYGLKWTRLNGISGS